MEAHTPRRRVHLFKQSKTHFQAKQAASLVPTGAGDKCGETNTKEHTKQTHMRDV